MVRAPCCEKMGLKKGPWTPEEDKILVSYIQNHGHDNWRALPKLAGLMRCGKSCRLRWVNYLKPNIKRGNFSQEEEETIIKLHEMLGNRWSVIATKLPGRTDNEIKNVWHTHLKKQLGPKNESSKQRRATVAKSVSDRVTHHQPNISSQDKSSLYAQPMSPQPSSSDYSSSFTDTSTSSREISNIPVESCHDYNADFVENFPLIDEEYWTPEIILGENAMASNVIDEFQLQFPGDCVESGGYGSSHFPNVIDDGMEFWYDLFVKAGGIEELL